MIVEMKKAHIIIQESERTSTVEKLSRLGLMHVRIQDVEDSQVDAFRNNFQTVDTALQQLPAALKKQKMLSGFTVDRLDEILSQAKEVVSLNDQIRLLQERKGKYAADLERLQPWGDFSPTELSGLSEQGFRIELRIVNSKDWKNKPASIKAWIVSSKKGNIYTAILQPMDDPWDGGQLFIPPANGLAELRAEIDAIDKEQQELYSRLQEFSVYNTLFKDARSLLAEYLDFSSLHAGMEQADSLCIISGFIPSEQSGIFLNTAKEENWGALIQNPDEDDSPPTLLKNPRWIRIIQPVFNLLGTVPGYREYDISAFFLVFFAAFFGMIISDAGYGSLLLSASILLSIRSKRREGRVADGLILFMVLSAATVIWGGITGNWFGYEPIKEMQPFSLIVIPMLDSFDPRSIEFVQLFCFILGLIHLSLAFLWNTKRALQGPHKLKAIAELGWLTMVVGLFFLVLNVVLGKPLPEFSLYLIIGGFISVTIFSEQEGNFLQGIGKGTAGLMTNALSSVSRFSDIVSYIRLFAVGLASIEIAKSFNAMGLDASQALGSGAAGFIAGGLIIFVGHTINLFMAALSVVVHGVRLNMLEFSGALGMEWTGELFKPFKARSPQLQENVLQKNQISGS
ncbi:V-type ATP synthase subunit I [Spirochaeta dissipatitropha]